MRVGSIADNWKEGVGDLGLRSQPVVCSWHTTVYRGAGVLLSGGGSKVTLDFGLHLLTALGRE